MIKKAKEVGIKIILDFVPNHSSDENEWFIKSVDGDPAYTDFYIWHNGIVNETTGERQPPSNWVSAFRYSAWEWNEVRQQYYLHQFATKQPDLNYRNPAVVNEMKNVMRFWLGKGIAGFRIDAVPYLFEQDLDRYNNYPDEPIIDDVSTCPDPDDSCHLQHIYTQNMPETLDMVYQWRALADEFKKEHGGDTRILLTEAYTSFDNMILYYGNGIRNGSHIPFNFDFLTNLLNDTKAPVVVEHIENWMNAMPDGVIANWVLGNHDNKRLASRYGVQRADLFNILLQTLPGNAVTYNVNNRFFIQSKVYINISVPSFQGEELAMTDVFISWEDSVDPQACNSNPDRYYDLSRDPARTPYQWDASPNAGKCFKLNYALSANSTFVIKLQQVSPLVTTLGFRCPMTISKTTLWLNNVPHNRICRSSRSSYACAKSRHSRMAIWTSRRSMTISSFTHGRFLSLHIIPIEYFLKFCYLCTL